MFTLDEKYIFIKGVVSCNNLSSLINVLLQFTAFDYVLPCYSFRTLNSTKHLMLFLQKSLNI